MPENTATVVLSESGGSPYPAGGRAGGVHLLAHTAVPGAAAAPPVRTGHTLAGARMTQRGTQDVIVIGAGPGRRADSGTSSPANP